MLCTASYSEMMMGYGCRNPTSVYICSLLFISQFLALFSEAANNITRGQLVRDGETLLSSGQQNFVLGFFSPANSTSRYVGIWYNKVSVQTVIWVANRETPISGQNGTLTVGNDGNLMISDGNGNSVWSTNASIVSGNSTAILRDSGNLILTNDSNTNHVLWQTFEDPTDTFLPGMKAYANDQIGENRAFSSWKSPNDPSPGNYSMGIDPRASPQIVVWEQKNRRWRSGHWDGQIFIGVPRMKSLYSYGFKLTSDGHGEYFTYTTLNSTHIVRFMIRWDGFGEQLIWDEPNKNWTVLQTEPLEDCDVYNKCGNFGLCTLGNSQICTCIEGFEAQYTDQWNNGNWSGGCVRKTALQCESNTSSDGFLAVEGVKLPDYADSVMAKNTSDCEAKCLTNCSCIAYAFLDGADCMIWGGDLLDVEKLEDGGGTLYVRLANSEFGGSGKISNLAKIMTVVAVTIFLIISIWLLWRTRAKLKAAFSNSWRKKHDHSMFTSSKSREFSTDFSGKDDLIIEGKQGSGPDLPLFSFNYVEVATNYFANENKLGRGGFGPVFKGTLPGGQEIAVKRLSRWSGQGLEEFKNELILIAKLQHRNLVRLLGCCIEGDEKILVYEYMPNKSLDFTLFDPTKKAQLDWRKRFTIIEGTARGLLYLHRDSRLRIIHRDLKASNILLDEEMNPKISDFGMARIFGGNENEAETNRVVGTYGYMSPEYAMEGLFSVKSDVYSFGVLLLELVSGQRNNTRLNECSNLIRYAWKLWNDGKAMELVDPSIVDSCSEAEVLRCIHVGMLCVQESAVYRPNMSSVVLILESENANMPKPRQPKLTSMNISEEMDMEEGEEVEEGHDIVSSNDVTVTEIIGR